MDITGALCLGKYPKNLATLFKSVPSLEDFKDKTIDFDCSWFDLTMLSYLAILLRSCNRSESSLTLKFKNDTKYSFLWRSGFFTASRVGHAKSPFKVTPNIWRMERKLQREIADSQSNSSTIHLKVDQGKGQREIEKRANFTPLILFDTDIEC